MNHTTSHSIPSHIPEHLVVDINVYDPTNVEKGLHLAWKSFQDTCLHDMVWSTQNGGHWLPVRGPLIAAIYSDYEKFSNKYQFLPKEAAEHHRGIPGSMDPPEHQQFRSLLNPVLGPKPVMQYERDIRAMAVALIEKIKPLGECDFKEAYANILPVHIFLHLVDLPIEDAEMLQHLNNQIIRPASATMSVEEATAKLLAYLQAPIMERLGGKGTDLISQMINGDVFDRKLKIEEALNMSMLVLQGGLDSVANLMTYVLHFLASHPDDLKELVDNPQLIPAASEEMIRRFAVVVNARVVKKDMNYQGVEMRAGDPIALANMLHGLDEDVNTDSMSCDFHRTTRHYSTFGQGIHRCVGAHLARLEFRITLEEWLKRIPKFELVSDDIQHFGGLVGGMEKLLIKW